MLEIIKGTATKTTCLNPRVREGEHSHKIFTSGKKKVSSLKGQFTQKRKCCHQLLTLMLLLPFIHLWETNEFVMKPERFFHFFTKILMFQNVHEGNTKVIQMRSLNQVFRKDTGPISKDTFPSLKDTSGGECHFSKRKWTNESLRKGLFHKTFCEGYMPQSLQGCTFIIYCHKTEDGESLRFIS